LKIAVVNNTTKKEEKNAWSRGLQWQSNYTPMSIDSWPDLFKLLKKYIIPVAVVLFRGLKERVMVFVQLLMKCYFRVNLKGLKLQTLNSNPTCPLKSLTKYNHCLNTFFNTCIPDSYNNNDYQVQFYRTISCQTGEF